MIQAHEEGTREIARAASGFVKRDAGAVKKVTERRGELHPCELRAHARVYAAAEREVSGTVVPVYFQLIGIREYLVVTIAGSETNVHERALGDRHAAEHGILQRQAIDALAR